MNWLFDKREKSLANTAQKIVEDMHKHLDNEKLKNKQLESMILKYQNICTESLENDIYRLENRKKEIINELDNINKQLIINKELLNHTKEEIRNIMSNSQIDSYIDINTNSNKSYDITNRAFNSIDIIEDSQDDSIINDPVSYELEQRYLEENDYVFTCYEVVKDFLFLIHGNHINDIITYSYNNKLQHLIEYCKVINISEQPVINEVSSNDMIFNYDINIIPNQDREHPDIKHIPIPYHIIQSYNKDQLKKKSTTAINISLLLGQLIGAFEINCLSDIVIDIWKYDKYVWATTSIDNTNFAVLERIFITSEINFDTDTIIQIDLFGRNPKNNQLLLESILPSTE